MWDFLFGKHFSDDYRWSTSMQNPYWRSIRQITFALSLGRDCIAPWLRAEHADHLTYRRLGRELPWVDLVPLSAGTHSVVTELRSAGFKCLVNPLLRLAYGFWILPWIVVPWFLMHQLHLIPIGPIEAVILTQHVVAKCSEAMAILASPFRSV